MPNINHIYDFSFSWDNIFNIQSVELQRETITSTDEEGQKSVPVKVDDIDASIQPLNESDLLSLPEGDREREVFKIYTKYSIQKNDIIVYLSNSYKIKKPPQPWRVYSTLHHYKAFMYKIEE